MKKAAKHQQPKLPRWVAGPLYWLVRLKFILLGNPPTITADNIFCFSSGDILNISCSAEKDGLYEIVSVDSATTFTVRKITWYKRLYWWWCQSWYETFPYLSSRFVPV